MKINKAKVVLITLLITFFLHSCTQSSKEKNSTSDISEIKHKTDSIQKSEPSEKSNIYSTSESFLKKVRDDIPYTIVDLVKKEKKVPYSEIFPKQNLHKSTLYLRKEAENFSEIKYTDIFLMVLEYSSEKESSQAFDILVEKILKVISSAARGEIEGIVLKDIDPSHGSFIFKKGKYIISLGKKCGHNKLNLSFEEYENLCLKDYQHSEKDSKIIHSKCADSKFSVKK